MSKYQAYYSSASSSTSPPPAAPAPRAANPSTEPQMASSVTTPTSLTISTPTYSDFVSIAYNDSYSCQCSPSSVDKHMIFALSPSDWLSRLGACNGMSGYHCCPGILTPAGWSRAAAPCPIHTSPSAMTFQADTNGFPLATPIQYVFGSGALDNAEFVGQWEGQAVDNMNQPTYQINSYLGVDHQTGIALPLMPPASSPTEQQRLHQTVASLQARLAALEDLFTPRQSLETVADDEPAEPLPWQYRVSAYGMDEDSSSFQIHTTTPSSNTQDAYSQDESGGVPFERIATLELQSSVDRDAGLDDREWLGRYGTPNTIISFLGPTGLMDVVEEIRGCVPLINPSEEQLAYLQSRDPGTMPPPIRLRPVHVQASSATEDLQDRVDKWMSEQYSSSENQDSSSQYSTANSSVGEYCNLDVLKVDDMIIPRLTIPTPTNRRRGLLYAPDVQPCLISSSSTPTWFVEFGECPPRKRSMSGDSPPSKRSRLSYDIA